MEGMTTVLVEAHQRFVRQPIAMPAHRALGSPAPAARFAQHQLPVGALTPTPEPMYDDAEHAASREQV